MADPDPDPDPDRGGGDNHAIVDVQDFAHIVGPVLGNCGDDPSPRAAMDTYEDVVVDRVRPAVLTSRQACLDAHDWARLERGDIPLLTRQYIVFMVITWFSR